MKYDANVIASLAKLYLRYDTPVDQLAQDHQILAKIASELSKELASEFNQARTLDALLYARKTGRLPRIRRRVVKSGAES